MRHRHFEWVDMGIRSSLGIVLLWSSIGKLYYPYEFLRNVYDYDFFGEWSGFVVALVVPYLELVVGIALILNLLSYGSIVVCLLLMGGFVALQAHGLTLDQRITCGCFGPGGEPITFLSSARTAALFALAAIVVACEVRALFPTRHSRSQRG